MPNAAVAAFDAHVGAMPVPGAGRRTAPLDDRQRYMAYAYRAAVRNGLDPELFLRQLQQEAGFQPFNADGSVKVSPAGARGIAQIVPPSHPNAPTDDPLKAIDYAAAWMGQLKKQYGGDDVKALAAYNAGPGNVDKYGGVPPFAETQAYVKNIVGNQGGARLDQSDVQQAARPAGGDDGPFVSAFRSANGRDPSPAEVQMMHQQASGTSPRAAIRQRAAGYVGTPYEWGGTTKQGIDCSAFISNAWGIGRQTTDTLPNVAAPVDPGELEPGDALNLPTWKDPRGYGHVRMFDGWADPERRTMFVYESSSATNGVVRRVVPYDPTYQPMRLKGLAAEEPEQRALKLAQMTEQAGVTTPSRPGNDGGKPAPILGMNDQARDDWRTDQPTGIDATNRDDWRLNQPTAPNDQARDDWRTDQPTGIDATNRDDWRLNQPTAPNDQARDDWRLPTPAASTGPAATADQTPARPPRQSSSYVQPPPGLPHPVHERAGPAAAGLPGA
jgi:cell wall-associated NlpC family hydrolase